MPVLYVPAFAYAVSVDDHAWRERGAGARGQPGSFLRGYHLQCYATEEELEEHFQPIGRRKGRPPSILNIVLVVG